MTLGGAFLSSRGAGIRVNFKISKETAKITNSKETQEKQLRLRQEYCRESSWIGGSWIIISSGRRDIVRATIAENQGFVYT